MRYFTLITVLIFIISCKKEESQVRVLSKQVKSLKVYRQEYKLDVLNAASKLMDKWVYNIHGDISTWENRQVLGITDYGMFDYRYEYQYNSKYKITDQKEYEFNELNTRVGYVYDRSDTLIIEKLEYSSLGVDTTKYEYDTQKRLNKEYFIHSGGSKLWEYDYYYNGINQVDHKMRYSTDIYDNPTTDKYEYKYDSHGNILEEKHTNTKLDIYTSYYDYIYSTKGYITDYVERYDGKSLKYREQIEYNDDGTIKSKTIFNYSNVRQYFDTYDYEFFYIDELK